MFVKCFKLVVEVQYQTCSSKCYSFKQSSLYYMFYSGLKDKLSSQERPQAVVNFSSGVMAAMAATVLTQPADVVRTRMQANKTSKDWFWFCKRTCYMDSRPMS
eukprot:1026104-Pelagomonas_calceolata.AAC.2